MSFVHRLATTLAVVVLSGIIAQPAGAHSITAAGDISSPPGGPRGDRRTAGLIRRWNPTAVLALGDTQYEAGELARFRSAYDRSWGAFKARTHPAIGNDEYLSHDGAAGYFDYFGAAAGPRGLGYYSFDIGPWHLVALISSCAMVPGGGCAHGSAQWAWLKDDLASHPSRCTLAFFHTPYRASTALHGGSPELAHLWAQLVAGTGGRSIHPVNRVHPNSVSRLRAYGVYRLIMYPDHWVGAFKGVDGSTHDYTGQHCH